MAKRFTQAIPTRGHKGMVTRILYGCCAGLTAMALLATTAMAQSSTPAFSADGTSISAQIHEIGLPLVPLTLREMSAETAQGIPANNPTLATKSQGPGSVLLWDEVGSMKSTSQNSMSGTITLNIVH